jgi:hypothetical protein
MIHKKSQKIPQNFECKNCDYITSSNKDYHKHLLTLKHKRIHNDTPNDTQLTNMYVCICGRTYKYHSGYYRHKRICEYNSKYDDTNDSKYINSDSEEYNNHSQNILIPNYEEHNIDNNIISSQLIIELLKQNSEFKELILEQNKQILEQNKQILEISKDKSMTNCHNTTNNNHFNLQFFLNEKCKNALNMGEFIQQLFVGVEDLEETGRLGYVEGVSKIFIRGLKQLDIYKRPIHCSDAKREVVYIKNNDKWEKDNNNINLTNAIKQVANKNIKQISEWQKLHPNYNDSSTKDNDKYLKIVSNAMCGISKEETENNYSKIVKNVIKETIIQKI